MAVAGQVGLPVARVAGGRHCSSLRSDSPSSGSGRSPGSKTRSGTCQTRRSHSSSLVAALEVAATMAAGAVAVHTVEAAMVRQRVGVRVGSVGVVRGVAMPEAV